MNNENKKKGERAEKAFADYLNAQSIPFYRIDQNKETYSDELQTKNIRRPDYLIHTDIGKYHIDVKFRTKLQYVDNEKRYYLNQHEIESLYNFQKQLNSAIWIAFTNNLQKSKFYYLQVLDIHDYYTTILKTLGDDFFNKLKEGLFERYEKPNKGPWIYIPEKLLYTQLSCSNGFQKEPDSEYYKTEAYNHKQVWKKQAEKLNLSAVDLEHYFI
jgi:Holliday junction resolvase